MPDNVIRLDDGWFFDSGHRMDEPPLMTPLVPPPVQKKKGRTMGNDYVPRQRSARYLWYKNISDNVVAEGVKFGAAAGEATAVKALAEGILAKMEATDAAQAALDSARATERTAEAAALAQLRAQVRHWKTLAGWPAAGSEAALQLRGTEPAFDPLTYKTVLKVLPAPGAVRVDFTKKGVDGVFIYMRVRGAAAWRKLGMDTEAPYLDTTPLAQPGVPEVREYMARGFLHDEEIGQDSDVVRLSYAG